MVPGENSRGGVVAALAHSKVLIAFYALVAVSVAVWAAMEPPGWDLAVYRGAIHSLAIGHDPYVDSMVEQELFHRQLASHPDAEPPFSYLYPPITLPPLRLAGHAPEWISRGGLGLYWVVYIAALIALTWITLTAASDGERRYFLYLAPVAAFFPGLLASGTLLGGNVAYIVYAAALGAALAGWKRGRWRWFYIAVLLASCIKPPFLTLLAIPVLSARRQALPAGLAALTGCVLVVVQPWIWPRLFQHYLQMVELLFRYNREFGSSPGGLFSYALYRRGLPYDRVGPFFYIGYAVPLFLFLLYLSRRFLRGSFTLEQWMPIMLTGVILLNPRLIEYDVSPLTIPLALIGWRFLRSIAPVRTSVVALAVFFVVTNGFALTSWSLWKMIEGPLLVMFFGAGSWTLMRQQKGLDLDFGSVSNDRE